MSAESRKNNMSKIETIDVLLPQTQCELCTYKGCRPYAEAIVNDNECIDRCEPGGVETLKAIAEIMQQNPEPLIADVQARTKPLTLAVIREDECIGCTKCIQACPVDAIIGSGKQMHTVITDACSGCELCIPPCPVDCIDIVPHPKYDNALEIKKQSRERFETHKRRLQRKKTKTPLPEKGSITKRKAAIQEALLRVKRRNK